MSTKKEKDTGESKREGDVQGQSSHEHKIHADVLKYKIKVDQQNHQAEMDKKNAEIDTMRKQYKTMKEKNDSYEETIKEQSDRILKNEQTIKEMKNRESQLEEKIRSYERTSKQQKKKSTAVCKEMEVMKVELSDLKAQIQSMNEEKMKTTMQINLLKQQLATLKKAMPSQDMMNEILQTVRDIKKDAAKNKENDPKTEGHKLHVENVQNLQIGHQAKNKMEHHTPPINNLEFDTGNKGTRSVPTTRNNAVKGTKKK